MRTRVRRFRPPRVSTHSTRDLWDCRHRVAGMFSGPAYASARNDAHLMGQPLVAIRYALMCCIFRIRAVPSMHPRFAHRVMVRTPRACCFRRSASNLSADGGPRTLRLSCAVITDASNVQRLFLTCIAVQAAQGAGSEVRFSRVLLVAFTNRTVQTWSRSCVANECVDQSNSVAANCHQPRASCRCHSSNCTMT
jgi:hypothetical protein